VFAPGTASLAAHAALNTVTTSGGETTLQTPTSRTGIILAPFYQPVSIEAEIAASMSDSLSKTGYSAPVLAANGAVSIELMKTINQYGVIVFVTHGGLRQPPCDLVTCAPGQTVANPNSIPLTGDPIVRPLSNERRMQRRAHLIEPAVTADGQQVWAGRRIPEWNCRRRLAPVENPLRFTKNC
jgi:hypothetical protein